MVISLFFFLLFGCGEKKIAALPAGDSQRPDIILVSLDSLRADHLSSYGYQRPTSPFLDQLAEQGSRFHWARSSSPWTLPSHITMFTGQSPANHKVVDDDVRLSESTPVLPELLQKQGWATGGFVSTLYVSRVFGFERGFDYFQDFDLHTEKKNLRRQVVAPMVIDDALDWWSKQDAGKPIFLFIHLYDTHYNYLPPTPYNTLFDRVPKSDDLRYKNYFYFKKKPVSKKQFAHQVAQYDESIRYVDDQLKRIADKAAAAGRKVRWIVTADHGEEFGERGSWGHAHTLYAEQLRIPLIISGDGIPKSVQKKGWAATHDIAPTIGKWAGFADKLAAEGIDLMPHMAGKSTLPERSFVAETSRFRTNRLSLLLGNYRMEWNLKNNRVELYDPIADPQESKNLSADNHLVVKGLKQEIEKEIGYAWKAEKTGMITVKNGVGFQGGRQKSPFLVEKDSLFQIVPANAQFWFREVGTQLTQGPYSSVNGTSAKAGDPVSYLSSTFAKKSDLSEETKRQLERLGYIQNEE